MKLQLRTWVLSLSLMVGTLHPSWGESNAAMVTGIKGEVTRAGVPIKRFQKLPPRAELSLDAGEEVTVVYLQGASATQEVFTGPGTLTIGEERSGHSGGTLTQKAGPGGLSAVPAGNAGKAGLTVKRADGADYAVTQARLTQDGLQVTILANSHVTDSAPPYFEIQEEGKPIATGQCSSIVGKPGAFLVSVTFDDKTPRLEADRRYRLMLFDSHEEGYEHDFVAVSAERAQAFQLARKWANESDAGDATRFALLAQVFFDWCQYQDAIQAAQEADLRTGNQDVQLAALLYDAYLCNGDREHAEQLKARLVQAGVQFDQYGNRQDT